MITLWVRLPYGVLMKVEYDQKCGVEFEIQYRKEGEYYSCYIPEFDIYYSIRSGNEEGEI